MATKEKIWGETFKALTTEKKLSYRGISLALGKSESYIAVKFTERNPAYFTPVQVLALQTLIGCTKEDLLKVPEYDVVVVPEAEVVDPKEVLKLIDELREIVVKWADQ